MSEYVPASLKPLNNDTMWIRSDNEMIDLSKFNQIFINELLENIPTYALLTTTPDRFDLQFCKIVGRIGFYRKGLYTYNWGKSGNV